MRHLVVLALLVAACGGSRPTPVTVASADPPAATPTASPQLAAPAPHVGKVDVPQAIRDAIGAPDRSDKDRDLDARRRPGELLAFAGITAGMRVADLGAGLGYTTEILARAVGPNGLVYSENNRFVVERFAKNHGASAWRIRR